MTDDSSRRTPLYSAHVELGARMVPFAGWEMPVQYAGILEEARAVRSGAGIFDISHMGRVRVSGPGAEAFLDYLTPNDIRGLAPGCAHYSLLTNNHGGIIDDIIVYRVSSHEFYLVINAGNAEKDLAWLRANHGKDVVLADETTSTAMIALQGPAAVQMLSSLAATDVWSSSRFTFGTTRLGDLEVLYCRTGYTGEDGFELVMSADAALEVWGKLLAAGAVPCGLGARDALRIEAGYPLYGHEIGEDTNPVEAGLMWVVKLDKGDFVGRSSILEVVESGPSRRLVGLRLSERIVPRQGYNLFSGAEVVGTVTSGVFSPVRGVGLGMAYLQPPFHRKGSLVDVDVRGRRHQAIVVPKKDLISD